MSKIVTYPFKPIINNAQALHTISIEERIKIGGEAVLNAHRTDFYILLWVTKGKSFHMVDFQEIEVKEGDLLFINPNQIHGFREGTDYEGKLIAFPDSFYSETPKDILFIENASLFNSFGYIVKINLSQNNQFLFTQYLRLLEIELGNSSDNFQFSILHNHLSNMLILSERIKAQESTSKLSLTKDWQYVGQFNQLVSKNYRQQFTVSDYAELLKISERRLQKATKITLAKTPKQLMTEELIVQSKRLLIHETMTIKEISYELGFDEPSNFTKFFKKHTGAVPTIFRENEKNKKRG